MKYDVDLANAEWHKATKSGNNGGCVEVAEVDGFVAVRDSTDTSREPLVFDPFEWECFLDGAIKGEFPVPKA